jgi:Tfp pilus assembly protein PilF
MARRLVAEGKFAQAEQTLRTCIKSDDRNPAAHDLLAYTLLRLNQPKESLVEYTRAAQIQTPSAEDLIHVSLDYVLLDDYKDAERWIRRALAMNDKSPDAWYDLGRILYVGQRFKDAADCFERALSLDPQSAKAENNLGLALEGLNRTDDAIAAYRRGLQMQTGSDASKAQPSEQPMLNLAIILIHRTQYQEASSLLTQAVAIAPKDPAIREQLGHLYLQQEKLQDAQRELETAVALSPDNSAFHFLLGQVYHRQGTNDKASIEFSRAAALNGSHSTPEKR